MTRGAILVLAVLGLAACDDGGFFDPDTPDMRPDKVARLQAPFFDLRVFEFTPQTAPNMQCVFVAGDQKGGVFCFAKPEKAE